MIKEAKVQKILTKDVNKPVLKKVKMTKDKTNVRYFKSNKIYAVKLYKREVIVKLLIILRHLKSEK